MPWGPRGIGGGGGINVVSPDHIFESETVRDTHFSANLDELLNGLPIFTRKADGNVYLQEWTGADNPPSYNAALWNDEGVVVADAATIKTLYESNSNTNAFTDAFNLVLDHIRFDQPLNRLITDVALQVPPGTVYVGPSSAIGAAIRALHARSDITGNTALLLAQLYDSNGFTRAFAYRGAAAETVNINDPEGTDTADVATFSITTTADELLTHFAVMTNQMSATLPFTITLRTGSQSGPEAVVFSGNVTTDATGRAELNLSADFNPILVDINTTLYANVTCQGMLGVQSGADFTPNARVTRIVVTRPQLAYVDDLPGNNAHVTAFSIEGQSRNVPIGTTISGAKVFDFNVEHPELVSGTGTISQDGVQILTGISPFDFTVSGTVNSITLNSGESTNFVIEFSTLSGSSISKSFRIAAQTAQSLMYFDIQTSSTAADFDYQSATAQHESIAPRNDLVVPTYTGSRYIAIAQPASSPNIQHIYIRSTDQIGGFSKNAGVIQINSVDYDVWITNNPLIGSVMSGETLEVVR